MQTPLEVGVRQYIVDNSVLNDPDQLIIAGGYARDKVLNRKPKDIDIFVLDASGVSDRIEQDFIDRSIPHTLETKSYDFLMSSMEQFDQAIKFQFMQWDVHLVCTPCRTPNEVVSTFDYNICQFWVDPSGPVESPTTSHERDLHARNMILQHERTPVSSLRRGFNFESRLHMTFLPSDIQRLVEALYHGGVYDI